MERVVTTEPLDSDRDLVARCQAGDEAAFDELVRRHQQRAVNVAWQLLRDREDAVEVAQDAFVSVYRNIAGFRNECEFTTWLHRIVVNLARNRHRWWHRRGREQTMSLDAPLATDDGPLERQFAVVAPGPQAEAAQAEFVEQVTAAMGRLPRKYREALVLRNVEELSYEEIATVLRCSVGTVKSRIARGREKLRETMSDER
jgi:RNA polymerase sigma-70 factor (ECF subfamily)